MFEGVNLREARIKADLTTKDVARLLGVSHSTIVNWERGRTKPNNAEMYCLKRLYGLDSGDFLCPEYDRNE